MNNLRRPPIQMKERFFSTLSSGIYSRIYPTASQQISNTIYLLLCHRKIAVNRITHHGSTTQCKKSGYIILLTFHIHNRQIDIIIQSSVQNGTCMFSMLQFSPADFSG